MYKNKRYRGTVQNFGAPKREIAENVSDNKQTTSQIPAKKKKTTECEDLFESEDPVPASQPPTQSRYLSQRSNLGRTQSRNLGRVPNTYFEVCLQKSGAEIHHTDSFVLTGDHLAFVTRLKDTLSSHHDYPENINHFLTGFKDIVKDDSTARKLFNVCAAKNSTTDEVVTLQDSMISNFFMVDVIQRDVLKTVLDKLKQCAQQDTTHSANNGIPLFRLMLSQLRFVVTLFDDLLYEKIIEIYELATREAKEDLILNINYLIAPRNHDKFAEHLISKATSNEQLFQDHFMQMFCNLYLSLNVKLALTRKIFDFMKERCQVSLLPLLVDFLLKVAIDEADTSHTIDGLHTQLSLVAKSNELTVELKSVQLSVFNSIDKTLTRSKKIYDVWLKIIISNDSNKNNPIDLILLLAMMSIREERVSYIENIIRRKIKSGLLTPAVLNECKNHILPVVSKYTDILLQLASRCLSVKNIEVQEFGRYVYRITFGMADWNRQNVVKKLIELACDQSDTDLTTISLEILLDLQRKHPVEMQSIGMILLPLLDRVSDFSFRQYRNVMALFSFIAHPPPDLSSTDDVVREHLDMFLNKQIVNVNMNMKMQGIIGLVQLINRLVRTEDGSEENIYDLDVSYDITTLPDGKRKDAVEHITRITSAITHSPELLMLFYDEIAMVFSAKNKENDKFAIDRHFMNWFCSWITNEFQNSFTPEKFPTDSNIELTIQNCINTPEDCEELENDDIEVCVNIAGYVFNTESTSMTNSIEVLPALVNLMRVLHFCRYYSCLESINAILGCGVILPSCLDSALNFDIYDNYETAKANKIIDVYFYTVNWYREMISAFASQNDIKMKRKVLQRISQLIVLQEKLMSLIEKVVPSDYHPPLCKCLLSKNQISPFKKPIGRPKPAAGYSKSRPTQHQSAPPEETEGMSILATARTQNPTTKRSRAGLHSKACSSRRITMDSTTEFAQYLRQMDPDIMFILNAKLNPVLSLPEEEIGEKIGLKEFQFIMSDLVNKLESVIGISKFGTHQPTQYILNSNLLITEIVRFMPQIVSFINQLSDRLRSALAAVNNAFGNADLFTVDLNLLKNCFGLCLRLLVGLFSWPGFDEDTNHKVLQELLRAVNDYTLFEVSTSDDLNELAGKAFDKFYTYGPLVLDIQSAVHNYHLLKAISKFCSNSDRKKTIRMTCKQQLCRKWYNSYGAIDRGAACNILLDELLKGLIENLYLKDLNNLTQTVFGEAKLLRKKDDCLKVFPNIHKGNFPMLFRALCDCLIINVNNLITGNHNGLRSWEKCWHALNLILNLAKELDIPRNFSLFIKHALIILKLFIQHGIPVIEKSLSQNPERVSELLKKVQITTRFLHNLCCHSKAIKYTAIVVQIPVIRETVENLVFQVKAVLAANKCNSVFWMGNLKNKDLHGDEILSQNSSIDRPENESDEDIPPDDNSIDETILDVQNAEGNANNSPSSSRSNYL